MGDEDGELVAVGDVVRETEAEFPVVRDAMEEPPVVEEGSKGKGVVTSAVDIPETTLVPLRDGVLREEVTARPVEGTVAIKWRVHSQALHAEWGEIRAMDYATKWQDQRLR